MLTLVKTKDAVPIVGIYSGKKTKRPDETVYFTHDTKKDNQNVASAAGVLHLHKPEIKREFRLNEADFKEVCRMIDDEEEPEQGDPLRHEFWQILERYDSGLLIMAVQLQDVNPPTQVQDAFIDVASAREVKNRIINEAQGYRNAIIPETRGKVSQILNAAAGYRAEKTRKATGDADRFKQILREYQKAKSVTRKRLYLETMEEILPGIKKVILDQNKGRGVLPILPLGDSGGSLTDLKGTR